MDQTELNVMARNCKIAYIRAVVGEDRIKEIQKCVDTIKENPQYRQYVKEHKMNLIRSEYSTVDQLLDLGIIED